METKNIDELVDYLDNIKPTRKTLENAAAFIIENGGFDVVKYNEPYMAFIMGFITGGTYVKRFHNRKKFNK